MNLNELRLTHSQLCAVIDEHAPTLYVEVRTAHELFVNDFLPFQHVCAACRLDMAASVFSLLYESHFLRGRRQAVSIPSATEMACEACVDQNILCRENSLFHYCE